MHKVIQAYVNEASRMQKIIFLRGRDARGEPQGGHNCTAMLLAGAHLCHLPVLPAVWGQAVCLHQRHSSVGVQQALQHCWPVLLLLSRASS